MSQFDITVEGGQSVRLPTAGKYCDRDIVVTSPAADDDRYDDGYNDGYAEGESVGYDNALAKRTDLIVAKDGDYTPEGDSTGFRSVSVSAESVSPQVITRTATAITADDLKKVTEIGKYAFAYYDTLASIALPEGVTHVGERAFYSCTALESITIPSTFKNGGNATLHSCFAMKEINFNATEMDDVTMSSGIFNIVSTGGKYSFNVGANVKKIPTYLFYTGSSSHTNIKSLNFAENSVCKSIGDSAFNKCVNLEEVTIPEGMESIGAFAFSGCTALKVVRIKATTPPTIQASTFYNVPKDCVFYVPKRCLVTYKYATNWSALASQFVEDDAVDEGGDDGNWLFKDEYIDGSRDDLPAPVEGVSYTCFVDGEEIGTSTAANENDRIVEFQTEDYRVWLIYEYGAWVFHPIDSAVQSGTVSIRING
jgi:hypothetical protein